MSKYYEIVRLLERGGLSREEAEEAARKLEDLFDPSDRDIVRAIDSVCGVVNVGSDIIAAIKRILR